MLLGCQPDGAAGAPSPAEAGTRNERPGFCSRDGADAVRDVFCAETSDPVHRLLDLERRLSVSLVPTDAGRQNYAGGYDSSGFMPAVLLAHSTALNGQLVSPINPRAILVAGLTTLAFTRGVQQVEIITLNRNERALAFYLLDFEQACNRSSTGCVPGDLYTPRIESDWERVTVRDAEELKNTPSDCRQCHQRGRDSPLLLMRELEGPWTHFFQPDGGRPYEFPSRPAAIS